MIKNSTILITGGTGSFGQAFVKRVLADHEPKRLIIFSRDELKQYEMQQKVNDSRVSFFIGDVRDNERLNRALQADVDILIHAAALKQVPACEYNPFEAIKTNIVGAENIINSAIDCGVKKIIALSTDKAVNPINLYGATKLCAEKLFVQGNSYAGSKNTHFSCVRYGNVIGSRGSVVPLFLKQRESGCVTVTDKRMTRFWITLNRGVDFVIQCLSLMHGGEIFVPRIPSMNIMDLVKTIAPECEIEYSGIRPGEKLHEVLISSDESLRTVKHDNMFVIQPQFSWWRKKVSSKSSKLPEGFIYSSDTNTDMLSKDGLNTMIQEMQATEK